MVNEVDFDMTIIDAATYELQRNGLSHPYVIAFPWVCWTHALILTKYCKADRPSLLWLS